MFVCRVFGCCCVGWICGLWSIRTHDEKAEEVDL